MTIPPRIGVEHESLGQEIAAELRRAIIEGRIAPGERLLEAAIADRMGVSRGPVRDAILELERQGLVVSTHHHSAFVAEVSKDDLEEIYTLRMALEGLAARLASQRIKQEQLQELQETIDTLASGCDLEQTVALDLCFHESIAKASGHTRLQGILYNMRLQTELLIRTQRRADVWLGPGRLGADHQAILDAIRGGDAEVAEQRMRKHIDESGIRLIDHMHPHRNHGHELVSSTRKEGKESQ